MLSYSCSTLLLEATVRSPIHIIFPEASSSDESDLSQSDNEQPTATRNRHQKPRSSRRLFEPDQEEPVRPVARGYSADWPIMESLKDSLSAQERLHSLLSNYVEPEEENQSVCNCAGKDGAGKDGAGPFRVKFKPPPPRFRHMSGMNECEP